MSRPFARARRARKLASARRQVGHEAIDVRRVRSDRDEIEPERVPSRWLCTDAEAAEPERHGRQSAYRAERHLTVGFVSNPKAASAVPSTCGKVDAELNVVDVGARVTTDERHFTSWPSIRLVDGILLRRAKARGRASAAVLGESYAPAKRGRIEAAEGVQGRLRSHREQSLLANPPPPELSVHSKADRKEQ